MIENWNKLSLSDIVIYVLGGDWGHKPSFVDDFSAKVKVLRATDFNNWEKLKGNNATIRVISNDSLEKRQLKEGDIIIEISGGSPSQPVGRVLYIDNKAIDQNELPLIYSNFFRLIRVSKYFYSRYVFYYLNYAYEQGIMDEYQRQVTNLRNLQFPRFINEFQVRFPPYPEQREIAQTLDDVFYQLDYYEKRLSFIPKLLEKYQELVLEQAVSGKLTESWRRNLKKRSKKDSYKLIDLIIEKPRNGYSPKSVRYKTNIKSLSLSATTSGTFKKENFKYLDIKIPDNSYLWLKPGDILIQRANTINYLGVSAIYEGKDKEFIYPDLMMKIHPNEKVLTKYLHLVLLSKGVREYFRRNAKGTTGNMPKINQKTVSEAIIQIPSIEEQKEVVKQHDNYLEKAKKIEEYHLSTTLYLEQVRKIVLEKAFKGELASPVNEEISIDELLQQITIEKEAVEQKRKEARKKRRQQPKPPKMTKETLKKIIVEEYKDKAFDFTMLNDLLQTKIRFEYDELRNLLFELLRTPIKNNETDEFLKAIYEDGIKFNIKSTSNEA